MDIKRQEAGEIDLENRGVETLAEWAENHNAYQDENGEWQV